MAITIRTSGAMKSLLGGQPESSAEGGTVREVLANLNIIDRLCDADGGLRRHFNIHVNEGEDIRLGEGMDTPLSDGDTVTILSAIAGGGDVVKKVWLTVPADQVNRPLIWEVGQKFKVVTNVRQASVSKELGLVGLELSGSAEEVAKAIEFFGSQGVSVEPVELDVVE